MKVIKGFAAAKAVLSRRPGAEFEQDFPALKQRIKSVFGRERSAAALVRQIVDDVRARGDRALTEYTLKIDGIQMTSFEVSRAKIEAACREVDKDLVRALKLATRRIRAFHLAQKRRIRPAPGQVIRPLEIVGAYAPGGSAAYPSTVLMTAIPARVAGVPEVVMVTPPRADGSVPAATLAAADIAGVDRVFAIGGAQAIAAMAYGTESVPRVDKICGPGNIFVVLAKKLVYGAVAIDGLHGPSEVLIVADSTADAAACAADLLAQAEHDSLASSVLVTTSAALAERVQAELETQVADLPRRVMTGQSLEAQGMIVVVRNMEEAIALANLYAPEHLYLMVKDAPSYVAQIQNAGCICLGAKSTVALSDYVVGPSHVLPTGGTARFTSPLSVLDFIKVSSVVDIDAATLGKIGGAAVTIARAEGLEAHARAIEKRFLG
jgi:histidinol dehydrogenase